MKKSNLKIVLYEPEIPQNTGNIARLCACIGADLILIGKLGFSLSEKYVKRAGLDYWKDVNVIQLPSLDALYEKYPNCARFYMTTKAKQSHYDAKYEDECMLIFGPETRGLPMDVIENNIENCFRIPMIAEQRSLNLSNSVAITAYEAIRQLNNGVTIEI